MNYVLRLTEVRYPHNVTMSYQYSNLDNLLAEVKKWVENENITGNDILRIEIEG